MQTMTSANYLPAGCKAVKLNLAGAYRTTYTHLVPGDEIRIQRSLYRETFDPSPGNAPSRSFWAKVTKVERGAGWIAVEVESAWYTGQVSWTVAHTAVTRKERPEEYSARLMLAEQERAAAVKASEEYVASVKEKARLEAEAELAAIDAEQERVAESSQPDRPEEYQAASRITTQPVSVHDFKPDFTGMCQKVVDRPSGIPTICGEPIKSAIHDPAAYAEYATELGAALAEWSGRKASGRYIPGKAPSAPVGLVIPVEEQTSDMSIRRGVQVWHPDYAGTVWVVRFTHGLGSDLVADLIHFGTGDQLRDVKVRDLTPVIHLPEIGRVGVIPTQRQPMLQTDMRARAMKAEAKLAEVEASLRGMLQEAKEARHHANRLGSFDREAYAQADTRVAVLEEALGYLI